MYSATPPENTMRPNGPRDRSTGVIHNPISPSCNVPPMISRISLPIALAKPSRRLPATRAPSPGTSTPADWASRRPASSNRTTLASLSQASSLAPRCTAAVSRTSPRWQTANFVVPPPISTLRMGASVAWESSTAPDPCAARRLSRFGPAVAQTNFPPSWLNNSATARAFSRSAASPVVITAPPSTSSGANPAAPYASAIN